MAGKPMGEVIQTLRKTALVRDGMTDAQLLADYFNGQDEAALASLIKRHAPMVWGVCRRVLRNHQDVEDAFQATFLVFVRKAASITNKELLANWLYGVARQTALKARTTIARRNEREKQVTVMPEPAEAEEKLVSELRPLLDQELGLLPRDYRAMLVLCDLEGKTRQEAARCVGCPEGTVASRLARARTLLAKRLARHGLPVSGAALAVVLSQESASAGVPAAVVNSTIKAAGLFVVGQSATGAISLKVLGLAEGVLKAMLLKKRTTLAVAVVLTCMFGLVASAWVAAQTNSENAPQAEKAGPTIKALDGKDVKVKAPPREFTNHIGMKFVWIPPGSFIMGSPNPEKERQKGETQHKVTLTKGYYMGVYPVTQEQWQQIMGNNPSDYKGEKNLPVEMVSWDDCQEFIMKLRGKDNKPYRLPTEAEWEYGCRAGTKTPFHFGETISTDQANYNGNFKYGGGKIGVSRTKTTPVGSFPANAFGLFDMHGNVYQWCQDRYGDYPRNQVVDPKGPNDGKGRVMRGGCYYEPPRFCRSAYRTWADPEATFRSFGFRLCFSTE
jgi:RNA polymerase sigma factor (sigma-70 family)